MENFARPIAGYMTSPVHGVSVDTALDEVARELVERRVSCLLVLGRDGGVAGVISHSDLLQIGHVMARSVGGKALLTLPAMCAGDLMTSRVVTAAPDTTVAAAATLMRERAIHRLFVVDGGKPAGVFSARDVMRALLDVHKKTPLARYMTTPALTIDAAEPLSAAAERLYAARATGLVVIDKSAQGTIAGVFTQVEALAARELPRDTPTGDAVGYSLLALPDQTPIDRAAGFALASRARRVVALGNEGISGVLTGLDFLKAVLD